MFAMISNYCETANCHLWPQLGAPGDGLDAWQNATLYTTDFELVGTFKFPLSLWFGEEEKSLKENKSGTFFQAKRVFPYQSLKSFHGKMLLNGSAVLFIIHLKISRNDV